MAKCPKCGSGRFYVIGKVVKEDGFVYEHYICRNVDCGYEEDISKQKQSLESAKKSAKEK